MLNETLIKAMGAFGGGIAGSGSVCGILSGGVALISSYLRTLKISPNLSVASIAGTLPR